MEHFIKIIGTVAILALTFFTMAIYKKLVRNQKNNVWRRLIPLWALLIGLMLGLIFYVNVPEVMPTTSLSTSIILGGICGWASVGGHQFGKLTFGEERKVKTVITTEQVTLNKDQQDQQAQTVQQTPENTKTVVQTTQTEEEVEE